MGPFASLTSQTPPRSDSLHQQAHPKYGSILASSSYDGKVLIWRESPNSQWTVVANFALHTASVNIVSWSPHESGCLLACASSDGQVSVLEFQEGNWTHQIFPAHGQGVNAVSWAPATQPGSLVSSKPGVEGKGAGGGVRRFVTGGSDGVVKIWDYRYGLPSYYSPSSLSLSFFLSRGVSLTSHLQHTRQNLPPHQRTHRAHRLGPGRSLGAHHPPKILHSLRGARQDGENMDQRPRTSQRVETDDFGIRRRAMEGELEPERERVGDQWRRQQGQLMEGEPERGVGLRQVDRGVRREM